MQAGRQVPDLAWFRCCRSQLLQLKSMCCCCCCCRVGAALLRGEWQAAVRLIMQGGPGERREYRQARALYMEQGDIQVGCRGASLSSGVMLLSCVIRRRWTVEIQLAALVFPGCRLASRYVLLGLHAATAACGLSSALASISTTRATAQPRRHKSSTGQLTATALRSTAGATCRPRASECMIVAFEQHADVASTVQLPGCRFVCLAASDACRVR
jgi:hypothetical protein